MARTKVKKDEKKEKIDGVVEDEGKEEETEKKVGDVKEKEEVMDVFSEQADKERIKKEVEERAKKLAEEISEEDIKKRFEEEREKEKIKKTLIPLADYLKYGVYIGTKVITPHMRPYVYKRRNDGIAIINTNLIDKKLKEFAELLAKYAPEDFILVCKRNAGWKAIETFSRLTGVRIFTKKYPAGIITNLSLPSFFETEMVFVCDPWMDRNAMHDAKKIKKPVFALCDINNYTFDVDYFVPCNNKSGKSIGVIFWILAREYLKARKIEKEIPPVEDFLVEE
jgi:small subunit ribosomal protein S2